MKNLFININLIQEIEINPKDQILDDLEVRIKLEGFFWKRKNIKVWDKNNNCYIYSNNFNSIIETGLERLDEETEIRMIDGEYKVISPIFIKIYYVNRGITYFYPKSEEELKNTLKTLHGFLPNSVILYNLETGEKL